jgi:hypothetical protein
MQSRSGGIIAPMRKACPQRLVEAREDVRGSRTLTVCGLVLAVLAVSTRAHADELRTNGGEVLVGQVVEQQPDFVIFESAAFGRVKVQRKDIASLQLAAPPAAPEPSADAKTEVRKVEEKAAEERQAVLSTDAVGRFLARINPLKGWNTRLGLGFVARRGDSDNDNDLTVRFRSERKTDSGDEHRLEARYYYAEDVLTGGETSATDELLTGDYRFLRPLTDPFVFQARSSYYRDAIKELDHRVTQTFGVGLRTERDRWSLSFIPAGGVQWRKVDGEDTTKAVVGFYQEGSVNITSTLKLSQTLDYLVAVDDKNDYSTHLGLDLVQKLGTAWSLGLRYEYNYDSVVGKNASEEQERWTLNLGLEF